MTDAAQVHERYTEGPLLSGVERQLSARSGARRMLGLGSAVDPLPPVPHEAAEWI